MIAFFLSIYVKYYENSTMLSRVIAKNIGDVFETLRHGNRKLIFASRQTWSNVERVCIKTAISRKLLDIFKIKLFVIYSSNILPNA